MHANPASLRVESNKAAFAESVRGWVQSKVAKHKYLRGGAFLSPLPLDDPFTDYPKSVGVVVIDIIPKR